MLLEFDSTGTPEQMVRSLMESIMRAMPNMAVEIDETGTAVAAGNPSGGESGGTIVNTDYDALFNKPKINGVTLSGDKSFEDLGLSLGSGDGTPDVEISSGVTRELLWSQTPASTNAGSKTLAKPITDYDIIQVVCVDLVSDLTYSITEVPAQVGIMGSCKGLWNLSGTANVYFAQRNFTLNESSITFRTGEYKSAAAPTSAKTNAGYMIPVAVYGIKY